MTLIDQHGQAANSTIKGLAATVAQLWDQACAYDGIDPSSKFVVLSDDNPYTLYYSQAWKQYQEALEQAQAFGYVGLRINPKTGRASFIK